MPFSVWCSTGSIGICPFFLRLVARFRLAKPCLNAVALHLRRLEGYLNTYLSSGHKGQHHSGVQGGLSSSNAQALMRPFCVSINTSYERQSWHESTSVRAQSKIYHSTCKAGKAGRPAALGSCTGYDTHRLSDIKGTPGGLCQLIRGSLLEQ